MYAQRTGGTIVLRIEDTDADRSQPELIDAIHNNLSWLGITWDEEYRQSDRFDLYRAAAQDFLDRGLAYRCDCSQEEVKVRAEASGDQGGYDGHCRDRNVEPGDGVVVRFRTPDDGTTSYEDLIRGTVEFDNSTLEDFVIVRSSGVPLFHVANAYDDLDMGITHVVRGEDLVNTVPRVLLLRQAMLGPDQQGTPNPVFAHLPLIVNEQRKKLSKRRDDVSVGDYADKGYLAAAMRNYLLTLGWGPRDGGEEIRPINELVAQFDLDDINAAPAFFDIKKLDHFNAEYIRALPVEEFIEAATPFLDDPDVGTIEPELFERLASFVQERVRRLDESASFLDWVVGEPREPSEKDWKKVMGGSDEKREMSARVLDLVIERIADCPWEPEALEGVVFGVGEELETKTQMPVRMALTGARSGIPLFEPMVELDRTVVLDRLRTARAKL